MRNGYVLTGTPQLTFVGDLDACRTEVRVRGPWTPELSAAAAYGLQACLAEAPRVVAVGLGELADPAGESAATWCLAARDAAIRQPPADVILCAVPPPVLARLHDTAAGRTIPVADSLEQARASATRPPWAHWRRIPIACDARMAALARAMVADACLDWGLSHLLHPACLIVSELVTNVAQHAGTEAVAAVTVRGSLLHVGVHDYDPTLPALIEHDPARAGGSAEQPGAGLRIVRAAAHDWGALPAAPGKVVWATLPIS